MMNQSILARAQQILAQGKPRLTQSSVPSPTPKETIAIEPASPTARPIYWESMDGTWHGPAKPEYLGRTGLGQNERFWVIVIYQESIRWIWADLLRSRQEAERLWDEAKK